MVVQTFLDDIRQLSARGDSAAALELIDLWLDDHPHDDGARLLKAEICLAARQNYAYVGQVLSTHQTTDQIETLRARSAEQAWNLVAQARERLRSRYPDDALDYFNSAIELYPSDPVIPLAAGLALLRSGANDPPRSTSSFEDVRRRLNPSSRAEYVGTYLRRVLEITAPADRPYEVAAAALVRQNRQSPEPESLSLLLSIPKPSASTRDLIAEVTRRAADLTLETVANLLRRGLTEPADLLLKTCRKVRLSGIRLYRGECLSGQAALAAYQDALRSPKNSPLTPDAARTLLIAVEGIRVACPHCGKSTQSAATVCPFCESPLVERQLLADRYTGLSEALLARAGMVEALLALGDSARALENWQRLIDLLPGDHAALPALHQLRQQIIGSPDDSAIQRLVDAPLNDDAISQINQNAPADWRSLPASRRARLIRRLIDAGHLKLAQATLAAAFPPDVPLKTAARLTARLDQALDQHIEAALRLAEGASLEDQIVRLTDALDLRPDARLYLARGNARLALGYDLVALDDFYAAASAASSDRDQDAARKSAALVLERRWDVQGSRSMIQLLSQHDPDGKRLLARLDRRERGEPVVLTERVTDGVMEDTLQRRAQPPYFHGFFAVALREVGASGGGEAWLRKLLSASFEFVQVLGALRDVMGDAVFVLRSISHPDHRIPERGSLTVALLVRVSAGEEAACRARALQLWGDIHAILPLAQENVYVFEPVVDEDELQALLLPFEPAHAAEIVRSAYEGAYAPYAAGTLDLHNLHWVFLRQPAPALISIHLKPTHLLPWERPTALDDDGQQIAGYLDPVLPDAARLDQQFAAVQLLEMQQVQMDSLRAAYLMRLYVAGSAGASQLLPEMTAAALLAPQHERIGGCEIVRAGMAQDFGVIRRNLASLDVESLPGDERRLRYLVGEREAAQVFRLPVPGIEGVPGLTTLEGKAVVPPAGMPETGIRLGMSVARVKGVPLPITQGQDDRRRHLYVVGKTGMGKSTLLMTLILQDIEAGRGVFLLDPHGDLCEDVLMRIPDSRQSDVILLDPSDAERPVGLNILDAETEADQHRIVNEFIGMLMRMYDPHNQAVVGPIFQQNVRNAMLAAMSLPDGTLIDVYRLLSDSKYIRRVLPYIQDPLVKSYWEEIASQVESSARDSWKAEMLPYLLSKFSRFVEDSTLRRMIGQPRTSIQWGRVMDEGKILLVNLAKGRIGQENAQFIGSLVLSGVLQAAFRRGELPASRRREFYLYIDEVQNYATPLLATMLSEGRKFGVILTIANQFLHQLDNGIREAVFGNVGSLVAFRVGTQDAPALAPEFYPVFSPGDLLNLPQFTACVKLLIDGVAARPFSLRTFPALIPPDAVRAARIRDASRQRYGTDIARVQREILKKF